LLLDLYCSQLAHIVWRATFIIQGRDITIAGQLEVTSSIEGEDISKSVKRVIFSTEENGFVNFLTKFLTTLLKNFGCVLA